MNMPIILLCGQAGVGKDTVGKILKEKFGFKLAAQADPIKKLGKKHFGFNEETLWGPSDKRNEIHASFAEPAQLKKLTTGATGYGTLQDPAYALAADIQALAGIPTVRPGSFGEANWDDAVIQRVRAFYKQLVAFVEKNGGLSARIVLQLLGTEVGRATDTLIWTKATFEHANDMLDTGAPGVTVTDGRFRSEVLTGKRRGAKVILIKGQGIATVGAEQHASETEILTVPEHMFDAVIENNKEAGLQALEAGIEALFSVLFPTMALRSYEAVTDVTLGQTEEENVEKKEWFYYVERSDMP